ncbi:hypothetical protein B0J12DRAFT_183852 [Macrophomina phaseolina]|uniref:Secreted protein n=1 Tax=Macrophomina phaseolina TaxID=35725 RepID=A0ABQ8G4R5_9PEZI|nr:hypothetical protein B0J12DRAFT_183852 [Macrophomina phaseolina]
MRLSRPLLLFVQPTFAPSPMLAVRGSCLLTPLLLRPRPPTTAQAAQSAASATSRRRTVRGPGAVNFSLLSNNTASSPSTAAHPAPPLIGQRSWHCIS